MDRFGNVVRRARIGKRMTLADIAEQVGFTVVHISEIERGKRNPPSESKVREWARALDLDEEELAHLASIDVDAIKVPTHRDPRVGEVLTLFARRYNDRKLSDEEYEQLRSLLSGGTGE